MFAMKALKSGRIGRRGSLLFGVVANISMSVIEGWPLKIYCIESLANINNADACCTHLTLNGHLKKDFTANSMQLLRNENEDSNPCLGGI